MCGKSRAMASRVPFGHKKASPMTASYAPSQTMNCSNGINGKVLLASSATKGLAGLRPKTFKAPNQKKTAKSEALERNGKILLKKEIII